MSLLSPGFALQLLQERERSNSKIIQKLKLSQKPSCTSPSSTTTCFHLNHQKPKKANYAAATLPAVELAQRLCVFPAKLALQCCSQIFTEMRINFQVVSQLNSLYFKNHQNFVLGLHSASPATLRLLLQSKLLCEIPMDPNLRTLASTWIDPPGKRVKVEIGSDVGTSLDFSDGRISGLWVDTPHPFARFQTPQSEIGFWG